MQLEPQVIVEQNGPVPRECLESLFTHLWRALRGIGDRAHRSGLEHECDDDVIRSLNRHVGGPVGSRVNRRDRRPGEEG